MMRCHLAAELRTFSRSPEIGTRMGGRQENRSSRWSVPLAVVLLATASCHSLGLSLGLSSPLSQQSKTYFHFRFVAFHGLLVTQHLHVQNCNARRIMMSILQSCTSLSRPGKEQFKKKRMHDTKITQSEKKAKSKNKIKQTCGKIHIKCGKCLFYLNPQISRNQFIITHLFFLTCSFFFLCALHYGSIESKVQSEISHIEYARGL